MCTVRTIVLLLLISCFLVVVVVSKQQPLRVYVMEWTAHASNPTIIYHNGDTTPPIYRLQKERAHSSILLINETDDKIIGRTTGLSFKVLDEKSNKWTSGRIIQPYKLYEPPVTIVWNGTKMKTNGITNPKIRDEKNQILAEFSVPKKERKRYLQIFSNRIPDTVYLLAIISHDMSSDHVA